MVGACARCAIGLSMWNGVRTPTLSLSPPPHSLSLSLSLCLSHTHRDECTRAHSHTCTHITTRTACLHTGVLNCAGDCPHCCQPLKHPRDSSRECVKDSLRPADTSIQACVADPMQGQDQVPTETDTDQDTSEVFDIIEVTVSGEQEQEQSEISIISTSSPEVRDGISHTMGWEIGREAGGGLGGKAVQESSLPALSLSRRGLQYV